MSSSDTITDILESPDPDSSPYTQTFEADARDLPLDDNIVDLVVTSPPYWQKRDYGVGNQIGQESSATEYVETIIDALSEWKRVLKTSGSVFLNIGDTYHNRSLRGIPGMIMNRAQEEGWTLRNQIVWAKKGGMPDSARNRLADHTEFILHLTPRRSNYYYDLHGFSHRYGNGSNPGDIWEISHDRNTGSHLAPFPEELVERAITAACPPAACQECGTPQQRQLRRTTELNESRQQAVRAMEIYKNSDLTEEHIRAIQSVGISDAGKAKEFQSGAGNNSEEKKRLAKEAKDVLGGYFREFTFAKKETDGWTGCDCDAKTSPGVVLDPFMGSGTTIEVANRMGFSAIGADLTLEHWED